MTTSSISSSDSSALISQLQAFTSGTGTLSESDIEELQSEVPDSKFVQHLADSFDSIDTNGDGISLSELQTYSKAHGSRGANRKSATDGQSPPEMSEDDLTSLESKLSSSDPTAAAGIQQIINNFSTVDTDGDGKISAQELKTYADANGITMPKPPGRGPGSESGSGAGTPPEMTKDELTAWATKLSSTDPTAAAGIQKVIDNFSSVDTDGDGKISAEEFKTYADANGITMPPPDHGGRANCGDSGSASGSASAVSTISSSSGTATTTAVTSSASGTATTSGSGSGTADSSSTEISAKIAAIVQSILEKYIAANNTKISDGSSLLTNVQA